jgi:hypothetical protein
LRAKRGKPHRATLAKIANALEISADQIDF